MVKKITVTHDDDTTEELDPQRTFTITSPFGMLRELSVMDQMTQLMRGLNTNERKRIIAWLADLNENVGVD